MTDITWSDVAAARLNGDRLLAANASPQTPSPFALNAHDVRDITQKEIDELSKRPRLIPLSDVFKRTELSAAQYGDLRKSEICTHIRDGGCYMTAAAVCYRANRYVCSTGMTHECRLWVPLLQLVSEFAPFDVIYFDL